MMGFVCLRVCAVVGGVIVVLTLCIRLTSKGVGRSGIADQ